eukprot:m.385709 g.385709  ORF g.385709 m.385709 type:complete len:324 (+) comp56288_c0_seq1:242-1213(+)
MCALGFAAQHTCISWACSSTHQPLPSSSTSALTPRSRQSMAPSLTRKSSPQKTQPSRMVTTMRMPLLPSRILAPSTTTTMRMRMRRKKKTRMMMLMRMLMAKMTRMMITFPSQTKTNCKTTTALSRYNRQSGVSGVMKNDVSDNEMFVGLEDSLVHLGLEELAHSSTFCLQPASAQTDAFCRLLDGPLEGFDVAGSKEIFDFLRTLLAGEAGCQVRDRSRKQKVSGAKAIEDALPVVLQELPSNASRTSVSSDRSENEDDILSANIVGQCKLEDLEVQGRVGGASQRAQDGNLLVSSRQALVQLDDLAKFLLAASLDDSAEDG